MSKITRRGFLEAGLGALAVGLTNSTPVLGGKRKRPNILMIVADDLGFSDLGCYGSEIQTPNLDKLASRGMRFTQFYNCAVCNVSRVAMLTGVNPRFGKPNLLRENMVTIAEVLKEAGYATSMSGKWHLGGHPTTPNDRGFQEYYGSMIGAMNYFDPTLPDPPFVHHSGPKHPFVHNDTVITSVPDGYYSTDAFTSHAVDQIRKFSREDKPFFLHLAYNAPHYPMQAPADEIAKHRGRYDKGYLDLRQRRHEGLIRQKIISDKWTLPAPDKKLGNWRYDLEPEVWESIVDKKWEIEKMEVYAAMVERMDYGVGRVLKALKDNGVEENTIIVFFSDNGGCASDIPSTDEKYAEYRAYNKGKKAGGKDTYVFCGPGWAAAQSSPFRRYKTWTYEGGLSTPMIVSWKGKIERGTMTDAVGHLVDLMPTFLDICSVKYPSEYNGNSILPVEGVSLKDVLFGKKPGRERELGWYLYGSRAYRIGKWKLVWGVTARKWELYDMETDRTETHDLSSANADIVRKLTESWTKWAARSQVPLKSQNA